MREITVAATQMACSRDRSANVEKASNLVRRAAERGAHLVLLQELFKTPYFCIEQCHQHLKLASPRLGNLLLAHFQQLAGELDSSGHWRRVMQGHAAANVMPVVASNRIGEETAAGDASLRMTCYGHSFICDYTGELRQEANCRPGRV